MADLITRLLLETGNFDNNLGKSSKQIKDFEVEIQDFSGKAVGYFSKFAGGIGAAITVGEAFNKTMQSNQTTSDLLENSINAAKDSVDNFFYALGTGD